ncbi:THO complex subunit 2 [Cymbomonas tetramitiformis]|uniref:THO complex subunit 2 n=1 Tax=Cymbomonas tetramitiformis TaxID=36881 RepID=A0AAE0L373_9CHLO|nr:THO complex subunit 2 [Cymbomonas tetramitiformis]
MNDEFVYVKDNLISKLNSDKIVASEAGPTISGINATNVKQYLMELCWAVAKASLLPEKFVIAVKAAVKVDAELHSLLADVIWYIGVALDTADSVEARGRLVEATKEAIQGAVTTARLLQERCEVEFLAETGLIVGNSTIFHKKEIRVNTRLLYTQNKFNLLREESEGYSKVVTTLNQFGVDALCDDTVKATIRTIQSLIGYFDLDPNRVFGLILDSFEQQPENGNYLKLLPLFPKKNMPHILGFKFQYYQRPDVGQCPMSLYRLAAELISSGVVSLDSLYGHLAPSDADALEQRDASIERRLEAARKIGVINLASGSEEEKPEVPHEKVAMTEEQPEEENQKYGSPPAGTGGFTAARALVPRSGAGPSECCSFSA